MRSKIALLVLAALALAGAAAAHGSGDDKAHATAKTANAAPDATATGTQPAMSAEEAEMMAKWQAAMTPGNDHAKLEPMIGKWKTTSTMWMEPGAPAMTSTGTAEHVSIFGNRYVRQTIHGEFMGMPFEGEGTTGYDNVQKKYVGTWFDNMGTGLWTSTGDVDASGKVFKFTGRFWCPIAGKEVTSRSVITVHDKNKHVMEMWAPDPKTGKEYKNMELVYDRAVTSAMR